MTSKIFFLAAFMFMSTLSSCGEAPKVTTSDPEATPQTVALLANLKALAVRGTMVGHQDALAYGVGWYDEPGRCDFHDVCGHYPALFGWEVGELEQGAAHSLDSIYFNRIRDYMEQVYAWGGVNTVSWHSRNPLTGGDAWDVSSDQVVASVLPGGEMNARYEEWLDRLADFFLSLKAEDGTLVPVIFRPFHELTGSWFWWGRDLCSVEQYVALWRYTAGGLRARGVHNLLWAYSAAGYATVEEFAERYPGDDYVDIVGFDAYDQPNSGFSADVRLRTSILLEFAAAHGKLPALTETGSEGLKNPEWFEEVLYPLLQGQQLSYVMLWRNAYDIPGHFYASWPGHASAPDMTRFVERDDILTLDEIDPLYE